MPVHVWQGGADTLVAPEMGRRIANAIPRSTEHVVPDAGHLLFLSRADEVFAALRA